VRHLPRWPMWLLTIVTVLGLSASPGRAQRFDQRPFSPEHGASVFGEPATTARDLAKVHDLGFPWAKVLFRWADIEHAHKGAYDWTESDRVVRAARAEGLKLIARLDFQPWWARADGARNGPPDDDRDYADFVYAFAQRYSAGSPIGRVHAIQVWNEPNLSREWGDRPVGREDAAAYVRLLAGAYRAVKEAGPGIAVISAGLAFGSTDPACCQTAEQYLLWMYEAGLRGNFDALGLNADVSCPCVEAEPGAVPGFAHPAHYFRHVERLRTIMVANGDEDKQVWLTEFGWPVHGGSPEEIGRAEAEQGELLVRAFTYANRHWAPWIGVMALWTIASPSWNLGDEHPWDDEMATWAITRPDGSDRPAYDRLLQAFITRELPWRRNGPP
jgi:polysaccharide biosynthesis protein PslG